MKRSPNPRRRKQAEQDNSVLVSWVSFLTWCVTLACILFLFKGGVKTIPEALALGFIVVCGNLSSGRLASHDTARIMESLMMPIASAISTVMRKGLKGPVNPSLPMEGEDVEGDE